jgi:ankyrin repeat protein
LESENIEHDAVQSCLAGYGRFQRDHDRSRHWFELNHTPTWHVQDEAAQTRTLRTVLDGVVSFDERHWSHKVCTAAQLCPPAALEILLLKNVSARPVAMPENVLQVAASRKRWSHSTMQLLLQAGSDQDLEDSDLRELLMASLAQFDDSDGSLFPGVRSLDELFVSGCGAAIAYLLRQLPHEDASGSGYAVLLQTAAAAGRLELVQLLIARNIDVNAIESQYGTALQAACRFSHTGVAEVLLKAGADPNLVGGKHCTALRAAVLSGSLPTVLLLLRFQADTELTGSRGSTALHLAVQEEHAPIVTALIAAGTSVKDVDDDEWVPTLLISACGWGECFVVRRLIEAGADLQATRIESRHTSAMHAAISGAHHDVVQLLISCGFDLTTAHPDADDLLTLAVCEEDTAIVTTLLHHLPRGCDTMLLQASKAAMEHNLVDTLVQLLDAAWDVKSVSMLVELIRTACHTPHASIAELLFDHFSTLNDESDLGTALATIDIRKVRGELFEVWLRYAPYTIELFVEVCIRGELDLVQQGIDIGHRPHINDKWSRSPLHLAAAQGRPSVIQRILETGTDVNRVHARYGTALVTALEGLSADKLKDKSIEELDISYATELAELENLRCNFRYADSSDMDVWSMEYSNTSKRRVPFNKPREFRASKVEYAETIILFLSNGARADSPPGRFGTPLALAAFAKHDGICGLLISHGAKADVAGGILGSPLSVAIDRGHENIVDMLLGALKRTEYRPGPGDTVFYRACRIGSPSIVRQLLDLGHEPSMTNSEGATALEISLEEAHWEAPCDPDRARIVHMLMDADTRPIFCADELVAVTTIRDSCFQTTLMDRILASTEQHKIPEESFIRLLRTRHSQVLQQILDKKAVTSVTTAMLASAYDIDQLTLLLEYDSSYVVTPVTIDAIQTGRGEHTRDLVQALLLRDPSLCPTESQMFRALVAEDSSVLPLSKRDQPRVGSLLDLMFSRNPDLSVTHEMLETVRDPGGLKVLLAHVEPGKHVLTDSILMALKPRRKFDEDGVSARSSLTHPRSEESSTSTASFDWFGMSEAPTDSSGSLLRSEEDDAATSLSERSRGSDEDGVSTHSSESPRGFEEDDAAASSSEQSCRSDEDGASTVPSVRSCRFDASSRRAPWETLLEIFLDFEPSVKVSSEVAQQLLEDCSLDTVELLLDHDSDIVLSSERIVSMLKSGRRRGFRRRRIAQILDSHPGQFAMTPEVEVFVDSCF